MCLLDKVTTKFGHPLPPSSSPLDASAGTAGGLVLGLLAMSMASAAAMSKAAAAVESAPKLGDQRLALRVGGGVGGGGKCGLGSCGILYV